MRRGDRLGSRKIALDRLWKFLGLSINEPGSACFQEAFLLLKDLRRPQGSTPKNVINHWQSLIKRSAVTDEDYV